jgi:hypothetical protein
MEKREKSSNDNDGVTPDIERHAVVGSDDDAPGGYYVGLIFDAILWVTIASLLWVGYILAIRVADLLSGSDKNSVTADQKPSIQSNAPKRKEGTSPSPDTMERF